MWGGLMLNPGLIGKGMHDVYMCGNDATARALVVGLLQQFGWLPQHILDLGDITAARGMEMILPLWLRIMGTLGTGAFNFQVVK
jgi:predicted dinucleotide-binding enzyme